MYNYAANFLPSGNQPQKTISFSKLIFFLLTLCFLMTHFPNYRTFVGLYTHAYSSSRTETHFACLYQLLQSSHNLAWRLSLTSSFMLTSATLWWVDGLVGRCLGLFVFRLFWHSNQAGSSRKSIWQPDSAQQLQNVNFTPKPLVHGHTNGMSTLQMYEVLYCPFRQKTS